MRHVLLASLAVTALVVGCGPATARFRDVEGRPLPTTARLDADVAPLVVRCPGGVRYLVVSEPRPYLAGTHLATRQPFVRDAALLCARIRAHDR
ncbi:MAG: hypothetical protein M3680_00730 [Myxococcota bacterium]|nr:hypothetical protein [Myxococcota bacterium]